MSTQHKDILGTLSEKEKQTLRLIVRGHDAKSTARSLGLSVHTINERLRDARRKMAVSSSREAARLLLDAEGGPPEYLGDTEIGEDRASAAVDQGIAPVGGAGLAGRHPWILTGVLLMMSLLAMLAFTAMPSVPASQPVVTTQQAPNPAVVDAARQWLALIDQGQWDASYRGTTTAFRNLNTAQVWAAASERVRTPLGAMISRTFLSEENLPAPPNGYEVVKFRTRYANKAEAIETVTLDREDGVWRVAGVTVE